MASLHPDHGARMLLLRASDDDAGVTYDVTVFEPEQVRHEGTGRIEGGAVSLSFSTAPPGWAETFLERLLKSLAKKHADDRAWPRRILRWRAP